MHQGHLSLTIVFEMLKKEVVSEKGRGSDIKKFALISVKHKKERAVYQALLTRSYGLSVFKHHQHA